MRALAFVVVGALGLLALAPLVVVALFGRALLYHPTQLNDAALDQLAQALGWQRYRVQVGDGPGPSLTLQGLVRPAPAPDAPWVLFFGGNAMSLASSQAALSLLGSTCGLAVVAYRGYDSSQGEPTQAALLADAQAVAADLAQRYGVRPQQLVIMGQSLGTGVAAHLAATLSDRGTPPGSLILLSPYASMAQVFDEHVPVIPVGVALSERFDTEALAARIACPVLLLHGAEDTLIPPQHSAQLVEALGSRATLVLLTGRGHNDLWGDARLVAAARQVIDGQGVAP